jgi:hypothetical protein
MKGRDFIAVAETLAGTEARERTSVGRSYYAAFSEAGEYVTRNGYTRDGTASHDRMWNYLRDHVPDGDARRQAIRRAIADEGFRLKTRRQKADYALKSKLAVSEPAEALRGAKRIIKELDGLNP